MRGVVTSYNRQKCAGIITADDGKEYTISRYDIDGLPVPERDDIVDFEPDGDKATDSVPIISKFLLRRYMKEKKGLRLVEAKDPLGNRRYMIINDEDWKDNFERYYTLTEVAEYMGFTVD